MAIEAVSVLEPRQYQRRWYQSRKIIFGIPVILILTALLATALELRFILALTLAVQIMFFVFLFDRPVWAFGALIIGQLTASDFMVPIFGTPTTVRFLWTLLTIVFLVPIVLKQTGIKLGRGARLVIIPSVFFFFIATVSNIAISGMDFTIQYLRIATTAIAILVLLPAVIRNEKDLKIFALIILVTSVVSSLFAIMQHFSYMGIPVFTIADNAFRNNRTPGLSQGSIYLAYQLPLVIIPLISLYFSRGVTSRTRVIFVILIFILLTALYFTFTRSGIYALAPALLVLVFLLKGTGKKELLIIVMVVAAAFLLYIQLENNRYAQGVSEESSAAGRLVLWEAGVNIALDNPILGIGAQNFQEVSMAYSSAITTDAVEIAGGILGTQQPHNDFLRVWISWGTLALLAYVVIIIGIFRNFFRAFKQSSGQYLKGLFLGCLAASAAYVINSALHNLMDSMVLIWILGGLSIACVKLAYKQKPAELTGAK